MTPRLADAPIVASNATLTGHFRGVFGESAVWSGADDGVWWVDMHGHAVVLTATDGATRSWKTPAPHLPWARAVVLRERGGLIVALSDGLATFDPATGAFTALPLDLALPPGHLFNDATVDASGRLIIGTMLPGRGNDARAAIYAIDADLSARVLVDGLNTTNGLAFSPDGRTLYYSDSFADVRKVWAAPYDPAQGTIGSARLFVDFATLPGKPDGAAVDSAGGYWSAAMASPYLHRFAPDGRLDYSVELPVDTPTRPAFGGSDLRTLYLTTAGLKAGETDDGFKGGVLALPVAFCGVGVAATRL